MYDMYDSEKPQNFIHLRMFRIFAKKRQLFYCDSSCQLFSVAQLVIKASFYI